MSRIVSAAADPTCYDILGGDLGRPQGPPLLTFLTMAGPGRMIIDPRVMPRGPIAKVVLEEFQMRLADSSLAPAPTQTHITELDANGRVISQSEKMGSTEIKTAVTYRDGRLASCDSTRFAADGKQIGQTSWKRWIYNAKGRIVEYRAGQGESLQNHYTNFKFDAPGRVTSLEYRQGRDDATQSRTEYLYRDAPHEIEVVDYDQQGEQLRSQLRSLDEEGQIVGLQIKERDWKSKIFKAPIRISFRYDAKGRLIEQVTEPYDPGPADEASIPPGTISILYDDVKHTVKKSSSQGMTTVASEATLDVAGDVIAFSMQVPEQPGQQMAFECSSDARGNWVDCKKWVTLNGQRKMTSLFRRTIVYR